MRLPDRGSLVWMNFTPQSGSESMGRRPAIVLEHDDIRLERIPSFSGRQHIPLV
jgi:mRNA interferase MazF